MDTLHSNSHVIYLKVIIFQNDNNASNMVLNNILNERVKVYIRGNLSVIFHFGLEKDQHRQIM